MSLPRFSRNNAPVHNTAAAKSTPAVEDENSLENMIKERDEQKKDIEAKETELQQLKDGNAILENKLKELQAEEKIILDVIAGEPVMLNGLGQTLALQTIFKMGTLHTAYGNH